MEGGELGGLEGDGLGDLEGCGLGGLEGGGLGGLGAGGVGLLGGGAGEAGSGLAPGSVSLPPTHSPTQSVLLLRLQHLPPLGPQPQYG